MAERRSWLCSRSGVEAAQGDMTVVRVQRVDGSTGRELRVCRKERGREKEEGRRRKRKRKREKKKKEMGEKEKEKKRRRKRETGEERKKKRGRRRRDSQRRSATHVSCGVRPESDVCGSRKDRETGR